MKEKVIGWLELPVFRFHESFQIGPWNPKMVTDIWDFGGIATRNLFGNNTTFPDSGGSNHKGISHRTPFQSLLLRNELMKVGNFEYLGDEDRFT